MGNIITVNCLEGLSSVYAQEQSIYLKPGIWVSLAFHLLFFSFLFFYGSQPLPRQDRFVELAEFNFDQPIKDARSSSVVRTNQKPTMPVAPSKPTPTKAVPEKSLKPPPVTDMPNEESEPKQNVHAPADSSTLTEAAKATEARPQATASDQPGAADQKKVVIAAQSSGEAGSVAASIWGKYGQQISVEASRLKRYPAAALSGRMQGNVVIAVKVSKSGEVAVGIARSSGFEMLDNQALSMVSQAVKNIAIPLEVKNTAKELFIPIQFAL